ncbi:hypothetical protein F66182_9169 [Fusarium sp. NRRL 66182]|nr:hypothetical protein F66182_9169 [Fusarium sp. NRRL 66182]
MPKSQSFKGHNSSTSLEWLLKPKQAREGMFQEKDRLRDMVLKFQEKPLTASSAFTEGRNKQLDNMWKEWKTYALSSGCDAEQVWIDTCMGIDECATPHFRTFLDEYIKASKTLRPCLDDREWHEVQRIKQAATIHDVWATLVKAADVKVISPRRKADPLDGRWNLDYSSQKGSSRNRTICEVGKWISTQAKVWNLSLEQSFEKVETTTEDLLLLLHTLWNREVDITCSAEHRVAFHSAVILLGVGGWRSMSILNLKYEDVEIARVKDPETGKTDLVATIAIHHVKQRANQARRDQRNRQEIWSRCLFVMGVRGNVRLYSLRVGTAGKLDGQLTSALRNYILSQSSGVYESSYHPVHLRENLMQISFGALAGKKDHLLTQMRRTSLGRDPRAPIYITKVDLENLDKRRDLTLLRQQPPSAVVQSKIKYIRDSLEKLLIKNRRQEYFDNIDQGKPVDRANVSTTDPRKKHNRSVSKAALRIAPLFEDEVNNAELIKNLTGFLTGSEVITIDNPKPRCLLCPSNSFANPQSLSRHVWNFHTFNSPFQCLEFQRIGNGQVIVAVGREAWSRHLVEYHDKMQVPNPESAKTAYCLFCAKVTTPRGFFSRYNKHQTSISNPFWCPECTREHKTYWVDGGGDDWVQHVRTSHGGDFNIQGAVIIGKRKREGKEMLPCKRAKMSDSHVDWTLEDWTPEHPGEHDDEEYWVTGYDGDYDHAVIEKCLI